MKLLIAAITFVATLGMLFLIETGKSPKKDYAQIVEALKDGNVSAAVSVAPSPIKTQFRATAPMPTITPVFTPTPIPSPTPVRTSMPSPTPLPTGLSLPLTPSTTLASTPTPLLTPKSTPEQSEKININTAGLGELDNITGVGLVIGQRIIDYRNANGPFQKIEDIKNVKGIGDKTFEKMKDEITI